jgi:uncharacterized protein YdcH (DUF465 family)
MNFVWQAGPPCDSLVKLCNLINNEEGSMPITAQDIRGTLMASDAEFQHLAEEHSRYESQLEQLLKQPYLSSEDLALEVTLKKMKLRLKDRMELLVARRLQETARS